MEQRHKVNEINELIGNFFKDKFARRGSFNQTFTRRKSIRPSNLHIERQITSGQIAAAKFLGA